jgi:pimeloyl-ACP methyl ester carboxylesterase
VPFHFDNLIYNRDDLTPHERRLLGAFALEDLTRGEVMQFRRWEKRHVWDSNGGSVDYSAGLANITAPALLLSGSADRLVPRGTVQYVMARLGSSDKTHRSFGKDMGDAHDFGHVDLACGHLAEQTIYPVIAQWLSEKESEPKPSFPIVPNGALPGP